MKGQTSGGFSLLPCHRIKIAKVNSNNPYEYTRTTDIDTSRIRSNLFDGKTWAQHVFASAFAHSLAHLLHVIFTQYDIVGAVVRIGYRQRSKLASWCESIRMHGYSTCAPLPEPSAISLLLLNFIDHLADSAFRRENKSVSSRKFSAQKRTIAYKFSVMLKSDFHISHADALERS